MESAFARATDFKVRPVQATGAPVVRHRLAPATSAANLNPFLGAGSPEDDGPRGRRRHWDTLTCHLENRSETKWRQRVESVDAVQATELETDKVCAGGGGILDRTKGMPRRFLSPRP